MATWGHSTNKIGSITSNYLQLHRSSKRRILNMSQKDGMMSCSCPSNMAEISENFGHIPMKKQFAFAISRGHDSLALDAP
jgi:hypothetical protein